MKQKTKSYVKQSKIQKEPSDFTDTLSQMGFPTVNPHSEVGQDVDEFLSSEFQHQGIEGETSKQSEVTYGYRTETIEFEHQY